MCVCSVMACKRMERIDCGLVGWVVGWVLYMVRSLIYAVIHLPRTQRYKAAIDFLSCWVAYVLSSAVVFGAPGASP